MDLGDLGGIGDALGGVVKNLGGVSGAIGSLKSGLSSLAGPIDSLNSGIKTLASGSLPSGKQAASMLGATLSGAVTSGADTAASALAKLGPAGQAAGAALQGLAAIASSTIGVLATMAGLAIEVSQKVDMMRIKFEALAGSAAAGAQVQGVVAKLAATLPFASAQVNAWAQSLLVAGLQGRELEGAIKAVAAAQALMGDSGASAAQQMIQRLSMGGAAADKLMKDIQAGGRRSATALLEMGLNTKDLAAALGVSVEQLQKGTFTAEQMSQALQKALTKKGAGALEQLGLELPNILQKAREGFLSLFSGVGPEVKGLMQAVKELFANFNKGSPMIAGMKPVVTDVLKTVIGWIKSGVVAAKELIAGFMGSKTATGPFASIGAALRKVWDAARALFLAFQNLNKGSNAGGMSAGWKAFAVVVEFAADAVAGMINAATAVIAIIGSLSDMVSGAGDALSGLGDSATSAASNFIDGLVGGITSGAGAVVDAVKGLASGLLGAFTGALGIKSPSTIMLEHGEENIAGAAATGVEAGTPRVAKAMADMGSSPAGSPKGGAAGSQASSGGGGGERHYHYHGPMSDYATFKRYVARYWQEAELEAGSAPEPA